jgi:hypothetical protein
MTDTKRAGVLLRVDGALAFLPVTSVLRIAEMPAITRVPGAPEAMLGIANAGGDVVPVISLAHGGGPPRGALVLCTWLGEPFGIAGAEVVQTGAFEVDGSARDCIRVESARVPTLDLAALHGKLRTTAWAGR